MTVEFTTQRISIENNRWRWFASRILTADIASVLIDGYEPITAVASDAIVDGIGVEYENVGLGAVNLTVALGQVVGGVFNHIPIGYAQAPALVDLFKVSYTGLDVPLRFGTFTIAGGAYFLLVRANGGAVGDAVYVSMWGHWNAPPELMMNPSVQPVSLEGYKWPLTRR